MNWKSSFVTLSWPRKTGTDTANATPCHCDQRYYRRIVAGRRFARRYCRGWGSWLKPALPLSKLFLEFHSAPKEARNDALCGDTDRLAGLGSDKWAVHIRAREMKRGGAEIIELTIGQPDIPTPTDMMDVARNTPCAPAAPATGTGTEAAVLCRTVKEVHRPYRPSDRRRQYHVLTPGTQTALSLVMLGLAEEGDEIITGDPLYATYDGVVRATGATRVSVPLRSEKGFRMQAADPEKVITPKAKVLLLNTPHNPTGAVLTSRMSPRSARFAAGTISGLFPMKSMSC